MSKNVFQLAKEAGYKKIMISRDTWGNSFAIVNSVQLKGDYGKAYGYTRYSDGTQRTGEIKCAGTYSWDLIKVLDESMSVEEI